MKKCIENIVNNCIGITLENKKRGKLLFFKSYTKEYIPLPTYHSDYIGPLPSANKRCNHCITFIVALSKITYPYQIKKSDDAIQ